jgi:hypothetical protein
MVAVIAAPTVAARFDTTAGHWTPDELHDSLGTYAIRDGSGRSFASTDILGLA